jgi:hypothetical protein
MAKASKKELQRQIISEASKDYNLFETYELSKSADDSKEVEIKTITKGVFKDEQGTIAVVCKFVNPAILKPSVYGIFINKKEVLKSYKGEWYFLCLTEKKTFAYNIELYNKVYDFALLFASASFDFKFFVGCDESSGLDALIIETEIAYFFIAGLHKGNYEEEERVILSKRLESSQPFFKFKAPIHFDWNKLIGDKDRQFERICELLLQKQANITRVIPIGKTRAADRGRDFEVTEKLDEITKVSEKKWLVQCKYSESSISPSSIAGWTDRVIEHGYNGYWLMTNNDITPTLFDQFKDVEKSKNYNIEIKFWQRSDFYIKLNVYSELFTNNDIFEMK